MKKVFIKIIKSCSACPDIKMDSNQTRLLCSKKSNRFICWDDTESLDFFPAWCPLIDLPLFDIHDMEKHNDYASKHS
jgi:hypothetical protein